MVYNNNKEHRLEYHNVPAILEYISFVVSSVDLVFFVVEVAVSSVDLVSSGVEVVVSSVDLVSFVVSSVDLVSFAVLEKSDIQPTVHSYCSVGTLWLVLFSSSCTSSKSCVTVVELVLGLIACSFFLVFFIFF
jgi:hypothetical protein